MPLDITQEELAALQQSNPELAKKIGLQIIEEAKQKVAEDGKRYKKNTSAPYYNEKVAKFCCMILDALVADKTHDIIIPLNMLQRSKSSAQQYYTQGFNYIADNPKDFPHEYQHVIPQIKIRQHEKGVWFHWSKVEPVELSPSGFIKIPLSDDAKPEAPTDELPIFNWRTQLQDWLMGAAPGDKLELQPLCLTEDDQQEAKEMIHPYSGKIVSVVTDNKIIVRYLKL